jgi:flagellar basal-body rod protein FlgG
MNGAFYIGATGLRAQQTGLDVIANNVANINTTAYKRSEVRFSELVSQTVIRDVNVTTDNIIASDLSGVQARTAPHIFSQGDLRQTGKPLDIAISGDGFIEVLGPGGQIWLWRGGSLKVNSEGILETDSGLPLKTLIEVPDSSSSVKIERDGRVRSMVAGSDVPEEIGTIDLVMPKDVLSLESVGGGYYYAAENDAVTTLIPGEDNAGTIVQGSVEASNVELTTEMVTLLLMQRAYAANAQVVQAGDQLMAIANGLRR